MPSQMGRPPKIPHANVTAAPTTSRSQRGPLCRGDPAMRCRGSAPFLLGWSHCELVQKHPWSLPRRAPHTQPSPGQGQSRQQSHKSSRPWESRGGYLNLQRRTSTNLILHEDPFPQTWVSLPFSIPIPSVQPSPLGSPAQSPLPLHSGASSLPTRGGAVPPDPSHALQTVHLSLQQDALSLEVGELGVGGAFGSVTKTGQTRCI